MAPVWKADAGLNARMMLSFVILGVLYIVFLSILHYLGVGYIPLAIIASAMILAQWYFSDKIVLWSSGAKIVSKEEYPRLHEIVERLSTNNGLPKPKVAMVNSHVPNAFATGKSPKSSLVAVTTGILDLLDNDELEAVIGHELSHVRSRDVLVLTLASLFSTVAWYLVRFGLFGGLGRNRNTAGSSAIVLLVAITTWVVSFLIIRAISRYREFSADRGGAIMTGKPDKLASALLKISGKIKVIPPKELENVQKLNAFFIIPALSGSSIANLFSTHPPVEKRVQKLMEMKSGVNK
ncbi:MAG: zinc metalloprotease HtpX [Nitrososphaeraceae archaeon]|mgnify:FL=1|jgi:heat shock protein HtpX|nr:zinc metalloprotease HtpX [Nitrososphaeraceae archaeon]MDW0138805.1 zinc metalloprotease HtpX [Nitrososphaeraceae archaeon]MDW0141679.1 zinc metalloprotease HtpX [Nitrososphaeraceae archaeon]MDW0146155.1 zinc metalloprotease HtpX [Nitrososphaeraceae archaeon]MDW0148219.1 zinc metalloprotease HtpX [Nitrososphaeraceae archaeon]